MNLRLLLLSLMSFTSPLAFSQDKIYWGDQDADKIFTVSAATITAGTTEVSAADNPNGIAYYHANPTYPLFYASNQIYRNNNSGSANAIITPTGQFTRGIAIDYINKKIYWANAGSNAIGRANIDGSEPNEAFITGLSSPWDIEIDPINQKLYWSEDAGTGGIKRANLSDGSNVETLINNIQSLGVAVDPLRNKIYYTKFNASGPVYAANMDGTNSTVITGLAAVADIDVDLKTGQLYLVDYNSNLLTKAKPDGTDKTTTTANGVFVEYVDVTTPVITSILRQTPSATSVAEAQSATFRITFSEPVLNLDAGDFSFGGTPSGSIVMSMVSLNMVYDVTINNILGTGTLDLNLNPSHNLVDFRGNEFAGDITTEETYAVTVAPTPSVTGFTPASGPVGTAVTITGTNFNVTPANNVVKFNGVTAIVTASTTTNITATVPATATTGTISVTIAGKTGTSANNFIVCTIPPKPIISSNGGILTSSAANGNQWLKNGVEIPGATSQNYSATEPGAYAVKVTSTPAGCSSVSDPTTITSAENQISSLVRVYPNPARNSIAIEFDSYNPHGTASIFSLVGTKAEEITLTNADGKLAGQVNVGHYSTGLYIMIIKAGDQHLITKFRKE
jgi:hypothetical protein